MPRPTLPVTAVVAALAVLALPTPAVAARVVVPHYTIYIYTAKVGVKGGESLSNPIGGPDNGDTATVQMSGDYSFDSSIRQLAFYKGRRLPRGVKNAGVGYGKAIVNGSWTASGTKWTDVANKITAPFTCTGSIDTTVTPQMQLEWKPKSSRLSFRLHALQQELWNLGFDACPPDNNVGWMQANPPTVFETTFLLSAGAIGNRTMRASVSGPLAENRKYFLQNCPSSGSCSMAWHGTVRLTRTKVIRIG